MSKPVATPIRVIEETPGYWRAVFDYPPLMWSMAMSFKRYRTSSS